MATKEKTIKTLKLRVTEFEYNQIRWLSEQYANGNMSLWLIHGALNAPRESLDIEKIKKSTRRKTKK